ncbi:phosphate acyltransferase PlsX [Candidatus Aerophobetes bacterium]|nr:phosphate acyltransferase PlsX [Candidatus Aerophobetes bacterium]
MKVAVDAMGAEKGISTVIEGSLAAIAENPDIEIILVGDGEKIQDEIKRLNVSKVPFSIVSASQVVTMEDSAVVPLKEKKDSSISVGLDLVKNGRADAFISAGNTGAVMATSLVKLGKLKGVIRPCLAAVFPTFNGKEVLLVDVGANVDCKPNHLFQFSVIGSVYAYKVLKVKNPRVALLNIGSEENKGNDIIIETFKLLKNSSLNFIGNIEGKDITSGKVEVVVCDGFVGNIILKFAEGFAITTLSIMDKEAKRSMLGMGSFLFRRWFKRIKLSLDYAEYGGVPLLGVNGICIIAHGASSSKAIKNAIKASYRFSKVGINRSIESALRGIKVKV